MKKNIKTTVMRTARAAALAVARPQPAADGAASITPRITRSSGWTSVIGRATTACWIATAES